MDEQYKPILCQGLTDFKQYYDTELFYKDYFVKVNGQLPVVDGLRELKDQGSIDDFEFRNLKELCEIIAMYKSGIVSLNYLGNAINDYEQKWAEHYTELPRVSGQTFAYVLSIARSSYEWWSEQEEQTGTRAVPAWVAADVGGAIVGAVIEGGSQYLLYRKVTNWKSVGCKALGGAVVASTGIAGKIGKWLFRL